MRIPSFTPVVAVLLLACSSSNSTSGSDGLSRAGSGGIETILEEPGHYSTELEARQTVVVNSLDEFAELWRRVYVGQSPVPELPEVDFARESVVLATPGMKTSGGYGVRIESLSEVPEGVRLVIVATSPAPNCMVTEALTTPVHIVRTPKLPGVVLFEWQEKEVEC